MEIENKSSNKQPKTDTGSALKSRSGITNTPELSLDWNSTTSKVYKEEADVLLFKGGDTSQQVEKVETGQLPSLPITSKDIEQQ